MNEKELLERLAELPREIRPGRDPWPEISARIENSPASTASTRSTPVWLFRVAASVVLVFAVGMLMKTLWNSEPLPSGKPSARQVADTNQVGGWPDMAGVPALLETVDAEYLAAFREFINVGGSRGQLTPQTIEKIEMGWADLRVTESALAIALEENPGDLFLNERMLELRARQLGFLQQLITLDRNNRRMTI